MSRRLKVKKCIFLREGDIPPADDGRGGGTPLGPGRGRFLLILCQSPPKSVEMASLRRILSPLGGKTYKCKVLTYVSLNRLSDNID